MVSWNANFKNRKRNNFRSIKVDSKRFRTVQYARLQTSRKNLKLEVAQKYSVRIDSHEFRSLVGLLRYLAKQTRPDIMRITNVLSRFMNDPTNDHFNAGKLVLRYLQYTKSPRFYPINQQQQSSWRNRCRLEWRRK